MEVLVVGFLLWLGLKGRAFFWGTSKSRDAEEFKARLLKMEERLDKANRRIDDLSLDLKVITKNLDRIENKLNSPLTEEKEVFDEPRGRLRAKAPAALPAKVHHEKQEPQVDDFRYGVFSSKSRKKDDEKSLPPHVKDDLIPEPPRYDIEDRRPSDDAVEPSVPPVLPKPPTPEVIDMAEQKCVVESSDIKGQVPTPPSNFPPPLSPSGIGDGSGFSFDWENFFGKKLFAWVGAFALFIAGTLLVKHAIDNELIGIGARLTIGLLVGAGAIAGGLIINRKQYENTSQGLCASGLAILFADFYAAKIFGYTDQFSTFALLASVTAGAFVISVVLDSKFVSILGLVGGFLIPPMLSTGHDNPLGLFAFIGLLNVGLLAVTLRKQWGFLMTMGAVGTVLTEIGWVLKFFNEQTIVEKAPNGFCIILAFAYFYVIAHQIARRRGFVDFWVSQPARIVPLVSIWYVGFLLAFGELRDWGAFIFSLLYLLNLPIAFNAIQESEAALLQKAAAGITFFLTWVWLFHASPASQSVLTYVLVLAFPAFYFGSWRLSLYLGKMNRDLSYSSRVSCLLASTFLAYLALNETFGKSPIYVFSLLVFIDSFLAYQLTKDEEAGNCHIGAGIASFVITCLWTTNFLNTENHIIGYAVFLGFPLFYFLTSKLALPEKVGSSDRSQIRIAGRVAPLFGMTFAAYLVSSNSFADNPWLGFSLLILLDIILAYEAIKEKDAGIFHLAGGAGTILTLWLWLCRFGGEQNTSTGYILFLGFPVFYAVVWKLAARFATLNYHLPIPARVFPLLSMTYVLYMLGIPSLGVSPLFVFSLLMLLDLLLAWQTIVDDGARPYHMAASFVSFLLLFSWTSTYLNDSLLLWGLGIFLVFALFHAAFPIVLQKLRPSAAPYNFMHIFPPLVLLLTVFPILKLQAVSFFIWPTVLLLNIIALLTAWILAWVWAGIAMLFITMGVLGFWIHRLVDISELPGFLFIEIFFSFAFHVWAHVSFPGKKSGALSIAPPKILRDLRSWFIGPIKETTPAIVAEPESSSEKTISWADVDLMPSLSAFLPFILLVAVINKLPAIPDPSLIFGLALILSIMLLRIVQILKVDQVGIVALISVAFVQISWHLRHFSETSLAPAIGWYALFFGVFFFFPFIFRKSMQERILPWISSSLSALIQFFLLYMAITRGWGRQLIGILPVIFAVPALLGVFHIKNTVRDDCETKISLLALFGGVALFFITLVFPLQFSKEWLTVSWAMEGAALLWLFRRVPHEGLKGWGIALLAISFCRFAFNPLVFSYHPRAAVPILNWYLYAYGIVTASLVVGGVFLAPPRDKIWGIEIPPRLFTAASILAFFLLNIEITAY